MKFLILKIKHYIVVLNFINLMNLMIEYILKIVNNILMHLYHQIIQNKLLKYKNILNI